MSAWLSPWGTASALVVGLAVAAGAGWRGVVLLFVFLISSSLMTSGGGRRRPVQVFANGGVAAVSALLPFVDPFFDPLAPLLVCGAIAAASADTWSTEIGGRSRVAPRLITTGRPVAPGVSGGVTLLGLVGGLGGALAIALAAGLVGLVSWRAAGWVLLGGCAGTLTDSLLGATLQARWRCSVCDAGVEQPAHCGRAAVPATGLRWLDNDAVNALATMVGALVAALPAIL